MKSTSLRDSAGHTHIQLKLMNIGFEKKKLILKTCYYWTNCLVFAHVMYNIFIYISLI